MPEDRNPPNYKAIGIVFLIVVAALAAMVFWAGEATLRQEQVAFPALSRQAG